MKFMAIGAHPDDIEIFMFGLEIYDSFFCSGKWETVLLLNGLRQGERDEI